MTKTGDERNRRKAPPAWKRGGERERKSVKMPLTGGEGKGGGEKGGFEQALTRGNRGGLGRGSRRGPRWKEKKRVLIKEGGKGSKRKGSELKGM